MCTQQQKQNQNLILFVILSMHGALLTLTQFIWFFSSFFFNFYLNKWWFYWNFKIIECKWKSHSEMDEWAENSIKNDIKVAIKLTRNEMILRKQKLTEERDMKNNWKFSLTKTKVQKTIERHNNFFHLLERDNTIIEIIWIFQ